MSTPELTQIQPFIQAYTLAISSILGTDVTVVDRHLMRVGGTSKFSRQIGEQVSKTSFFCSVRDTGVYAVISDAKIASYCKNCEHSHECTELADIAYPIYIDGEVAGVIGIVAFTEEQRGRLAREQESLAEFLKYMSMLIESKMLTQLQAQALESRLDEFVTAEKLGGTSGRFIGVSPAIKEVLALVRKIRASSSTVLISGESGTGKEVLAKLIHDLSPRSNRPMVSINCAAIPESLVESELFGYEGGAFTGAKKNGAPGRFEQANEGTIFFDEIGEMPLSVQTKLLRVLQEKKVQRVGGKNDIPVDVRIICATNQNLENMVAEGKFRLDLFYRLNVIPLILLPLRQRKEDIALFVQSFISSFNIKLGKNIHYVEDEAMQCLLDYAWPGNVRELKNIIEYLINVADKDRITQADLPNRLLPANMGASKSPSLKNMMADHEKKILIGLSDSLKTTSEKNELAKRLGISLATLYRKFAEHEIE